VGGRRHATDLDGSDRRRGDRRRPGLDGGDRGDGRRERRWRVREAGDGRDRYHGGHPNVCFAPTVLRTEPGQTVTFANLDQVGHTVLGANGSWGSFDLLHARTGTVSYRFVRPGVYAYVCTYHPGMVGTIVVGNASGPGEAGVTTTREGPVTVVLGTAPSSDDSTGTEPVAAVRSSARSLGGWPAFTAIAASLLLVALAVIVAQRRSLRRSRWDS
jgi:plastocyanin